VFSFLAQKKRQTGDHVRLVARRATAVGSSAPGAKLP
jgi:hypothetical protein